MVELSARMGTNAPARCSHSCIAPTVTGRDHQVTPKRKEVTPMRSSIIAGVDGSREATDAARVAASLARGLHRRLVLAHVVAGPPFHADRWQREVQRRRAIRRGTDLLEGVATEIGEPTARRRIALTGLIEGDLEDRLAALTREEDADLVVVGSRARGALARTLLGSVSASLANNGAYPVVVVPPAWGRRFADGRRTWSGSIVFGIDGSAESDRARIVAEGLADRLGLRLLPIHVDQIGGWSDAPDGPYVEIGEPATTLAEGLSRRAAQLVVVGTRGRGAGLDSVSGRLATSAPVPVLVVPPTGRLPRFAAAAVEPARAA
jgi:nucleotide-binding universal stress UspA family protein